MRDGVAVTLSGSERGSWSPIVGELESRCTWCRDSAGEYAGECMQESTGRLGTRCSI